MITNLDRSRRKIRLACLRARRHTRCPPPNSHDVERGAFAEMTTVRSIILSPRCVHHRRRRMESTIEAMHRSTFEGLLQRAFTAACTLTFARALRMLQPVICRLDAGKVTPAFLENIGSPCACKQCTVASARAGQRSKGRWQASSW